MHNSESVLEKKTAQTSLGFRETNKSPNLDQMTRPCDNPKKVEPAEYWNWPFWLTIRKSERKPKQI